MIDILLKLINKKLCVHTELQYFEISLFQSLKMFPKMTLSHSLDVSQIIVLGEIVENAR
jgi:hypothetical protein